MFPTLATRRLMGEMAFAPAFTAPALDLVGASTRPTPAQRVRPDELGLGLLFERVLDAVVVAGLSSGEIVLWNPGAERLFGYTAEEAIGQPVHILMPAGIARLHHAAVGRYLQTGRGLIMDAAGPVEVPAVTKDGQDLRIEISLSQLSGPDGERYALAVMRDATYRKDAELMRLEIERLRRLGETLLPALAAATHAAEG